MNFDVITVGGGPAGLSAAIYAVRAGCSVALCESAAYGGQMLLAHEIENYPGFLRVTGFELADAMTEQAKALGVTFLHGKVHTVKSVGGEFEVVCGKKTLYVKAVIAATGTNRRELGIPGEKEFLGRGVSYCAVCDGRFFSGRDVAVVGGGNTALGDALYLSSFCKSVTLIHRRDTFRADHILCERLKETSNIRSIMQARVCEISGGSSVERLGLVSTAFDKPLAQSDLHTDAVFIAIGNIPDTGYLAEIGGGVLDAGGYIIADEQCRTAVPGLFAAGDVRSKELRQIATAVSDGAIAGVGAAEYIKNIE